MEKQVIFRDRQEFQAADPNNMQTYLRNSLDHIVQDAISTEKRYTGFQVTQATTTSITVAPGRYYNDGAVFVNELAQSIQLLSYVPTTTKKCVAIVAWGQVVDEDVEPRDFILDLTTGATEPQAVAMRSTRYCQINPLPGVEAADPQPPVIQTGTVAVALVYLGTAGIESIVMQGSELLPNLEDHELRIEELESWRSVVDPRITGLASDLAALAAITALKAQREQLLEVCADLAVVKEQLDLPATYVSYEADDFDDATKSYPSGAGYSCLLKYGLMFPTAASDLLDLALANPIEPQVAVSTSGLLLPTYSHVPIMTTTGFTGTIGIASYQTQTLSRKKQKETKHEHHYGWHCHCRLSWFSRFFWKHHPDWDWNIPWFGKHHHHHKHHYEWNDTTSITGCTLGKTFLLPNSRWVTQLALHVAAIGPSGDVRVMITGTLAGKPDLETVYTEATVTRANLKTFPVETTITLPPAFLEGGLRYAIVLQTSGDHRVAACSSLTSSTNQSQGNLYYGQDGDWFVADPTKDLLFTLRGAQFGQTRSVVQLSSLGLSGGLTDIAMSPQMILPQGTDLQFEIQPAGTGAWYPLGDATLRLVAAPNLVNFRVVFQGTTEVQPALMPAAGAITVSRPDVAFTHWATVRTWTGNVTVARVILDISDWNVSYHTITPKLKVNSAEVGTSTAVFTTLPDGTTRLTCGWTGLSSGATWQLVIRGTRQAGTQPFTIGERIDIAIS